MRSVENEGIIVNLRMGRELQRKEMKSGLVYDSFRSFWCDASMMNVKSPCFLEIAAFRSQANGILFLFFKGF